jgi:hypothetical protein
MMKRSVFFFQYDHDKSIHSQKQKYTYRYTNPVIQSQTSFWSTSCIFPSNTHNYVARE